MRQIKFRVYNGKHKLMVYPLDEANGGSMKVWDDYHGPYIGQYIDGPDSISRSQGEEDTNILMQYTGLKDKNGLEIYEGDIVEGLGPRREIKWDLNPGNYDHGYAGYSLEPEYDIQAQVVFPVARQVRVIGNIYDNLDLLADENDLRHKEV